MFKNATIAAVHDLPALATAIKGVEAAQFMPCSPTQPRSVGFVPPREQHGAMIETIGGAWILAVQIETRAVPGATLAKRVDEMAAEIEQATGRKPGKKERRELKDQALFELLPQAFPKSQRIAVWIDPVGGLLVVDTASAARADDVFALLAQALPAPLQIQPLRTEQYPGAILSGWLIDGRPDSDEFDLGQECELKADDTKATVRHKGKAIDSGEVEAHVRAGMQAKRVALSWNDRVEFVLDDRLVLRRIQILDVATQREPDADEFDADVAIATGELGPLISDLIDAMGGEVEAKQEGGAA